LSDSSIHEPKIRALLGTALHFCGVIVLKLITVPLDTALSLRILRVNRRGAHAMYKRGGGELPRAGCLQRTQNHPDPVGRDNILPILLHHYFREVRIVPA